MDGKPEGYYLTCDDAVHVGCWDGEWEGFEDWTEPAAIFSDTESDTPTHCVVCHLLIDHRLTDDGYNYIGEAAQDCLEAGELNPVTSAWVEHYIPDSDFAEWLRELPPWLRKLPPTTQADNTPHVCVLATLHLNQACDLGMKHPGCCPH